ncbi:MAG: acetylglutamate kinase [Bacteriovoracaceae bacterium]|jgi:acetylglutamate kinase|nr:acetylglutamate kinase [Bacteriovoracaceae bacterium]
MRLSSNPVIVIKFGGEVAESESGLSNLMASVSKLYHDGNEIILVHGGGPLASKISTRLNLTPSKVGGRRVTCSETLEVMKMTLPGIINSNVLAILKSRKLPGVAVSGISVVEAVKRPPKVVSGSDGAVVDFGFVGDVLGVDPTYFGHLLEHRYIPVVSPLCSDSDGVMLNINADTISVQVARAVNAKKLVLVTGIGGVFGDLDDKSSKITTLSVSSAKEKILDGTIQGGMIPKLEEGFKLLGGDLDSFHIVGVDSPESILREIKEPGSVGTAVLK